MALEEYEVRKLDPLKVSNEIGIIPKSGMIVFNGAINLKGIVIPNFFMLRVGGGGDLFIRGVDGEMIPYIDVLDGQYILGEGNIVYDNVIVDMINYTTTCTNICAYSGQ